MPNIIEKIWNQHIVEKKYGFPTILGIDLHLMHEVTSAQAFDMLRAKNLKAFNPGATLATIDHSIPTRTDRNVIFDASAKNQIETIRENTKEFGIPLFDTDSGLQGVIHVIAPESGAVQPGMTIVCGDSHTATHGAFGSLAFGIGTTEVSHVLATGCLMQEKPKTMRVHFTGKLQKGVYAKDMILKLIAEIGISGANGHIIEYTGEAIKSLNMEQRMTICNMSIECGARAGLIAPDETTFEYLKKNPFAPKPENFKKAVEYWKTIKSDPDAIFDKEITIDLNELKPMVTWGTNPEQAIEINRNIPYIKDLPETHRVVAQKALEYNGLKEGAPISETEIQWAFLGSCTNGRIDDLRVVAEVLKNKKVHSNVTFYIVPGSEKVKKQAEQEGLDKIFIASGAQWRMPGCSICLAMNDDKVPAGQRCISSSNRNFVGRQGEGSFTHLANPATVAASAIAGKITAYKNSPSF